MSWSSWLGLPLRRQGAADPHRGPPGARTEIEFPWCAPGETLTGRVVGAAPAEAELLRLERSPRGTRASTVASADVAADGRFELRVPLNALPTARGTRCSVLYVVRAGTPPGGWYPEVMVVASGYPHVERSSHRADRMLACWDARRFHLELGEAELEGGGWLAGRIHRDRPWPAADIEVRARCLECWRLPPFAELGHAQWCSATLWEHEQRVAVEPRMTWAPWAFTLPADLPPAVEGRTIAWRYEVIARRRVRRWFDETAALTALLHDAAWSRPG